MRPFTGYHRDKQELYRELEAAGFTPDLNQFNRNLTDWPVEYNFNQPYQTLKYLTPIQFIQKHAKVPPMYPTSTQP